jgi:hypothetical protein
LIVYPLKGFQKIKLSRHFVAGENLPQFYITDRGRKQARNTQRAADPTHNGNPRDWAKGYLLAAPSCFLGLILQKTIGISREMWKFRPMIGQLRGRVNETIEARRVAEIKRQSHF